MARLWASCGPFALIGCAAGRLVAAFAAGAVLDLSRWSDAAAQRASAAIGRPVLLQGALHLKLGRELVLRVVGVELPSPAGFGARSERRAAGYNQSLSVMPMPMVVWFQL
jgi:hypothetical protein